MDVQSGLAQDAGPIPAASTSHFPSRGEIIMKVFAELLKRLFELLFRTSGKNDAEKPTLCGGPKKS